MKRNPWEVPMDDRRAHDVQEQRAASRVSHEPGAKVWVRSPYRDQPAMPAVVEDSYFNDCHQCVVVIVVFEDGGRKRVDASRVTKRKGKAA